MKNDHPLMRAGTVCPVCAGTKDVGLVVCWPCYRRHDLRCGNAAVERLVDAAEVALKNQHP